MKFSGNAQRRRRSALVFHGTILYSFDLKLIDVLLQFPSAQPEYRASRSHSEFVQNIPASAEAIRASLRSAWNADSQCIPVPTAVINKLVREQYGNRSWNFRRP